MKYLFKEINHSDASKYRFYNFSPWKCDSGYERMCKTIRTNMPPTHFIFTGIFSVYQYEVITSFILNSCRNTPHWIRTRGKYMTTYTFVFHPDYHQQILDRNSILGWQKYTSLSYMNKWYLKKVYIRSSVFNLQLISKRNTFLYNNMWFVLMNF